MAIVEQDRGPEIRLEQVSSQAIGKGQWSVGWQIENRGVQPMEIFSARLPHGQFKSEKKTFKPELHLTPGKREQFYINVRCDEPVGEVTENGFVIFSVSWLGERWRIFARVRVTVSADGTPAATTESITTQKIGFSGIDS